MHCAIKRLPKHTESSFGGIEGRQGKWDCWQVVERRDGENNRFFQKVCLRRSGDRMSNSCRKTGCRKEFRNGKDKRDDSVQEREGMASRARRQRSRREWGGLALKEGRTSSPLRLDVSERRWESSSSSLIFQLQKFSVNSSCAQLLIMMYKALHHLLPS